MFVVSTFDTDYMLVKEADLEAAVESLTAANHVVSGYVVKPESSH